MLNHRVCLVDLGVTISRGGSCVIHALPTGILLLAYVAVCNTERPQPTVRECLHVTRRLRLQLRVVVRSQSLVDNTVCALRIQDHLSLRVAHKDAHPLSSAIELDELEELIALRLAHDLDVEAFSGLLHEGKANVARSSHQRGLIRRLSLVLEAVGLLVGLRTIRQHTMADSERTEEGDEVSPLLRCRVRKVVSQLRRNQSQLLWLQVPVLECARHPGEHVLLEPSQ